MIASLAVVVVGETEEVGQLIGVGCETCICPPYRLIVCSSVYSGYIVSALGRRLL